MAELSVLFNTIDSEILCLMILSTFASKVAVVFRLLIESVICSIKCYIKKNHIQSRDDGSDNQMLTRQMVISTFCKSFFAKCCGGKITGSDSEYDLGAITIASQDGSFPVPMRGSFTVPTFQGIPVSLNKHDKLLHNMMWGGMVTAIFNALMLGTPMFVFYFAESHPETPGWNFMLTSSLIYFTSSICYLLLCRVLEAHIENDCFVFFYIIFHFSLLLCNAAMFVAFFVFVHNESGFIQDNAVKFMIFMYVMRLGGCISPCEKNR
jgi:hypothetical protein